MLIVTGSSSDHEFPVDWTKNLQFSPLDRLKKILIVLLSCLGSQTVSIGAVGEQSKDLLICDS
jgi:hypothetical protein